LNRESERGRKMDLRLKKRKWRELEEEKKGEEGGLYWIRRERKKKERTNFRIWHTLALSFFFLNNIVYCYRSANNSAKIKLFNRKKEKRLLILF